MHSFTYGSTVVFSIVFPVYSEGLLLSILIFTRCLATVTILNLLISTTSIISVLGALAWFRVPSALLDTTLLTLRFFFVISREASRMYRAQKARGSHSKDVGYITRLRAYGELFGMLIVRSYHRAVRVGIAMMARGYEGGNLFNLKLESIPRSHISIGVVTLIMIVLLALIDKLLL
ncbi:MAG: CbiQ family ECF transporter T component [Candidatus Nezhaarchaeales archaeon]